MNVTVFYAWQSDRLEKLNHYLIRDSAKAACERITADSQNDWAVTLDHDTKDVPGMCDIPNEILTKIKNCDIFIADLTLVGKTDGGKLLPNSNVIFELGYAAKRLSFRALVGVVNLAYGDLESQVFDIKRRKALGYTASEEMTGGDLKKVKEKLSKDLEGILRGTIEKVVVPKKTGQATGEELTVRTKQEEVAKRVLGGGFYGLKSTPVVVTSFLFPPHEHIDYEKVGDAVRGVFNANPKIHSDAYAWQSNGTVCEFSLSGYFHRVCTKDQNSLRAQRNFQAQTGSPQIGDYLHAQPVHRNIVSGVLSTVRFLTSLGIKPPWWVAVSIVGAKGFGMIDDGSQGSPQKFADDLVLLPPRRITALSQVEDGMQAGTALRKSLQYLTRSVGWEFNWYFLENGVFNLRIL